MQKKYKALIVVGAVFAVLAGLWFLIPSQPQGELDNEEEVTTPVPKLFAENEYIIDEQPDATYILIPKLNFKATAPAGWTIKAPDESTYQYWVDLYSPDAFIDKGPYLKEGCQISISAGDEPGNISDIKEEISDIKAGTDNSLRSNSQYEIAQIGPYEAVQWLTSEMPHLGQFSGFDIPIDNMKVIHLNATFPPNYKEQCEPLWQEFVKSITFN